MPKGLYADVLSPSAVKSFETCPKQYYYKTQGFKPKPKGNTANIGTCLHQLMETYIDGRYRRSLKDSMQWSRLNPGPNSQWWPDEVAYEALRLAETWEKDNFLPDIVEAGNLIFPITELAFGPPGDKVHGVVVKPANQVTFETGLRIHGFIDMIYAEIKDDQISRLVIVDWKTQREKFKNLALKRQAQIYALAVHKITNLPVRVEFVFLRFPKDAPVRWTPSLEELETVETELAQLQYHIKNIDHSQVTARISDECKWCPFNYQCDAFQKWINRPEDNGFAVWNTMPVEDLVHEFDRIRVKFNALKRVRDEMQQLMLAHMDRSSIDTYGPFEIRHRWTTEWNDHAKSVISRAGGLDCLPPQVVDELHRLHSIKSPSKPFLWKLTQ